MHVEPSKAAKQEWHKTVFDDAEVDELSEYCGSSKDIDKCARKF